jgi:cytochrome c556
MKTFTKSKLAIGFGAALIATASVADSHATKSTNADVAARHAMMGLVGQNMGVLGSTAKGEIAFNAGLVQAAAANLNMLAKIDPTTLWTAGTEQGAADLSRAKPEIWSDPAGFAQKFEDMASASAALMDAADLEAVRAGMGPLGGSCKACHESYRGPKN